MKIIEAVKESKSYENAGTNLLFKSCKKVNYNYVKHEYTLEEYIETWKKKIKTIKLWRDYTGFGKIDFDVERIENSNEIILKAKSEGIERSLVIEKSKLKEIIKIGD